MITGDSPTTRRDEASAVFCPVTEATRANSSADRARRSPQVAARRSCISACRPWRALHTDALMRAPRPKHRDVGIIDSPHADVNVLPRIRGVGPTDDLVLACLVGQPIADP